MSSAATDAFMAAWSEFTCPRVTLVKIELTVPSSLTLRYASQECHTPDGSTWQAGLMGGASIRSSVDWLEAGMAPASTSIRLAKRRDASQASGTIHDLLPAFLFQNAIVTIYLWAPDQGLAWADALQVFKGKVSRPAQITPEGLTLHLLQDQSWNFQLPPVVDKTNYPDSPDVSQGLAVPIVYGDHSAPGLPAPYTTPFGLKKDQEDSGGGAGVVPLVLVDAGVGVAKVKVVGACHEVADLLDRANGLTAFIAGGDILHPLDTAGITETLGAAESNLTVDDEKVIAYAAIIPIDVRAAAGGNTAGNPRRAMSPDDPTSFADLDQTTGKNVLQLILPNPGPLGRIESVEALVAYKGNAANANNMRVNTFTPGGAAGGSPPASWAATGTTPTVQRVTWPAAYWTQDWDFGGGATVLDIRVDFTGGASNKASIYWVVLVVKYRPQRSVVTPGKTFTARTYLDPRYGPRTRFGGYPRYTRDIATVEPTYRLDGQFYGNIKGYKDDGSGTYTGTASALIQRPPDIMRHFLITWGQVSSGDVEYGTDVTGSFRDARDVLRNAQPNDLKLACWIGDRATVQRVLQKMAEQSGMCVYQDRFSDKWLAFVWKPGAVEDYGHKFSWYEIDGVEADEVTVVDARRAIRVLYGYDHFRSRTLFEAYVNAAGSGQGVSLPTVRDQRLTVTAGVNDKVDFISNAITYAATIDPSTYVPIDLAVNLRGKMRALTGDLRPDVGYSFHVKTGFNDKLDFLVGGVYFVATLNPGEYTAEAFAVEVARAMNAVLSTGRVFACIYTHSTNKFTITATGGTFQLDGLTSAPNAATATNHILGIFTLTAAASSITSVRPRYGDRFWIANVNLMNVKWLSGTNEATNAAYVMGYAKADNVTDANIDANANYSRGDRERLAETLDGYYDPREETKFTADWIRDENTAVEKRNRHFDLTSKPRPQLQFRSFHAVGVRVMQVVELLPDVDPYVVFPRYGSDGSWAGKPMRVLEVEQGLGPNYATELLAMEA